MPRSAITATAIDLVDDNVVGGRAVSFEELLGRCFDSDEYNDNALFGSPFGISSFRFAISLIYTRMPVPHYPPSSSSGV